MVETNNIPRNVKTAATKVRKMVAELASGLHVLEAGPHFLATRAKLTKLELCERSYDVGSPEQLAILALARVLLVELLAARETGAAARHKHLEDKIKANRTESEIARAPYRWLLD